MQDGDVARLLTFGLPRPLFSPGLNPKAKEWTGETIFFGLCSADADSKALYDYLFSLSLLAACPATRQAGSVS